MKWDKYSLLEIIQLLKKDLPTHPISLEDLDRLEKTLVQKSKVYNKALELVHKVMWVYMFDSGYIYTTPSSRRFFNNKACVEHIPDDIINSGILHKDSFNEIRNVVNQLKCNSPSGQFEIRFQNDGDREIWSSVYYETVFKDNGIPSYAVFVSEDISETRELKLNYHQSLDMLLAVSDDIILSAKVNITQNKTEFFAQRSNNMQNKANNEPIEQLSPIFLNSVSEKVDVKNLKPYFEQSELLKMALSGVDEKKYEYKYTMPDGIIIWVEGVVRFINTHNGWYCYYYIRDIDHVKRVEQDLEKQAKYDKLTGIYNRESVIDLLKRLVDTEEESFSALILFNIDNVTQLIRNDSYNAAEEVLVDLSHSINLRFSGEKVLGRTDGFEILVFLQATIKQAEIIVIVNSVINNMHAKHRFPNIFSTISVSAGICFYSTKSAKKNFMGYLQNARVALDEAKRKGKNRYEIFEDLKSSIQKKDFDVDLHKRKTIHEQEILSASTSSTAENKMRIVEFVEWCSLQFQRSDFETAIKFILEKICRKYSADRAFVHFAVPGTDTLESRCYWELESSEPWVVPTIEETQFVFAEFLNALRKNESLSYNSIEEIKATHPTAYKYLKNWNSMSFFDYPIKIDGEINGYIGVDNPRYNIGDYALFEGIGPLISLEKKTNRLENKIQNLEKYDLLTGVCNRYCLTNYLKNLNVAVLSSIGIAVVRIANLKTLNNSFGRERIDSLLQSVAKAICTQFRKENVYRRTGNEFLIIRENIDFMAFEKRLEKIQTEIAQFYQGLLVLGSSWAESEIDVDSLIYNADHVLKQSITEKNIAGVFTNSGLVKDNYTKLQNEIEAGMYRMYLQPKAAFSDRSIHDAEALVRFVDESGKLVTPASFVHKLENTGLIYLIDFFMFEETCKFLQRQKTRGIEDFIISVNFSRRTLMQKNLIEHMHAISDKYDITISNIEIEITESVGDVEQKTISFLGKKIIDAGYRLSLDDFGSKFCNMEVLSNMELHALKLDKSLVKDVYASERSRKVIENFLTTCRQLTIESIAEGVETEEQFAILKKMGCDLAQGYLFNKPLPALEFELLYLQK